MSRTTEPNLNRAYRQKWFDYWFGLSMNIIFVLTRQTQPLQRKNKTRNLSMNSFGSFVHSFVRCGWNSLFGGNKWMNERMKKKNARNRNSAAANRLNWNLYSRGFFYWTSTCSACTMRVYHIGRYIYVWPLKFVVVLIPYYEWHELGPFQ